MSVACRHFARNGALMLGEMRFTGAWRDYQAQLLEEFDQHLADEKLHVVAAPGAGKTVLGLEIVRRIGRPALIFAPTRSIRDQWAQRLVPLFLAKRPEPGFVSHELRAPASLTIATYQALDALDCDEDFGAFVLALHQRGPMTLVLDEAHHLRREWWRSLKRLVGELADVRVVSLTATPPYDASFAEWSRYEALCGPIDLEIGIPELVRNGDLCPHQDHIIFSTPTADALALLHRRNTALGDLQRDLRNDAALHHQIVQNPWVVTPEACVEDVLDRPELLTAALVHLSASGQMIPDAPLKLLGTKASDLPLPSPVWLQILLDDLIGKGIFEMPAGWRKDLRDRLHRHGLIEGSKVRLGSTRSVMTMMSANLAKLDSIVAIARVEQQALGDALRMVVLSDHVRAGELPSRSDAQFIPARLGVIPIFETLRRAGISYNRLGVLTGTLVITPRDAWSDASASQAACEGVAAHDLPGCPGHVRLEGGGRSLVPLVTRMLETGAVRVLVGTQSLLGEGWDAPVLNSLVLASNTASFMLSNQMRGRAIRIDPKRPDKIANIWHLATIVPDTTPTPNKFTDWANWGARGDDISPGMSDAQLLKRRFRCFEGISNGDSLLIESGVGRLGIDLSRGIDVANGSTMRLAASRSDTAERWSASLGEGEKRSHTREIAAPNYAPRALSHHDTLQALMWSAAGGGAFAAADALRSVNSLSGLAPFAMIAAGTAALATLPQLARAALLTWRNGSIERSLESVGTAILTGLSAAGLVAPDELAKARFEIRNSLDGTKDVIVLDVKRSTERHVMQALSEVLGPVQNPRYLLVRRSWLGRRGRTDYHAVPTALGTRKDHAEAFASSWREHVGSSHLIYTRSAHGRGELLRARAKSFAAGFQKRVERRSAWL